MQHPSARHSRLRFERTFHDVENLADDQAEGLASVFEYQYGKHVGRRQAKHTFARSQLSPLFERVTDPNQRKNLPSVLRHPLVSGTLDLPARNVFKARQKVQRHRHARASMTLKQHQLLLRAGTLRSRLGLRGLHVLPALGQNARALRQAKHIENQCHPAVPHDRRPCKDGDTLQVFAERLHHNLFGVVDFVDHQPEMPPIRFQNHDVGAPRSGGDRRDGMKGIGTRFLPALLFDILGLQLTFQVNQRQEPTAQAVNRRYMNGFNPLPSLLSVHPHQFQQADLRDGIARPGAGNDERGDDVQGKRNLHTHQSSLTGLRLQVDRASDFFDVSLDHIHADATPGDIGYFRSRRKAGQENQIGQLAIAHMAGLFGCDQPLLKRFGPDSFLIEARSIVRDLDVDLPSFMKRPQRKPPLLIFPRSLTDLGPFDAVIYRIPHDVGQRIFKRLDQRFIELRLFPLHLDPYLLAASQGKIADGTWQLAPDVADLLHARLHHSLLQLGGNQVESLAGDEEAALFRAIGKLQNLIPRQHQLTHQVHKLVEQSDV